MVDVGMLEKRNVQKERCKNMAKLFLMCGIPGCGKSTCAKQLIEKNPQIKYVSRDEIRFSLLKEGEDYFAHEDRVFHEFTHSINKWLEAGYDVIADATHLNPSSRHKTMFKILHADDVNVIYVATSIGEALRRNELREGRAKVPESVILNMSASLVVPTIDEGFKSIFFVDGDKDYKIIDIVRGK